MIDENLMLFDIFVIFERDVRRRLTWPLVTYHNASSQHRNHKHHVLDSLACWRCLVRMHANVSHHRLGNLNLYELQGRNRGALREFAAGMRRLRRWSADCTIEILLCTSCVRDPRCCSFVYALHLGWRPRSPLVNLPRSRRGFCPLSAHLQVHGV